MSNLHLAISNEQCMTEKRQNRGHDLAERILDFAVCVIKLSSNLPRDETGFHIRKQILRSSTSAGANYEEARGAESRADFSHKMGIVSKELKESRYWLKLIKRADLMSLPTIQDVIKECEELCAIIGKSIITANSRK